jgi:uncharacterized protein YndB with AHSA1/START domain
MEGILIEVYTDFATIDDTGFMQKLVENFNCPAGGSSLYMLEQIPTPDDKVVIEATYAGVKPEELFRYLVEPQLLTQWWPPQAETDPQMGGAYHLQWPNMDWHLRGHYNLYEPPHRLGFTWQWDHEPEIPTRHVSMDIDPHDGGTKLTVTHGFYNASPRDREERQGHIDGWTHFLGRLQAVLSKEGADGRDVC